MPNIAQIRGIFENKKGEARSLALRKIPKLIRRRHFGGLGGVGDNIDAAAILVEQNRAIGEGKEGPIAPDADVLAGQKFAAALTDEDAASGNDLAAKFFYAKTFADAVASVTYAALTFFMCHKPEFLLTDDFFDFDNGQFLTVTNALVIAFAAFHLESELLLAANVFHHIGKDGCTGNRRCAHGKFAVIIDQKDPVKSECRAGFDSQTLNFQGVASGDTILFATCF
jgi:hypothetical protein